MSYRLLEEEVRVALDDGANESVVDTLHVALNKVDLASEEVLLVLQHEFWVSVNDLNDLACLDLVLLLQQVKEPCEGAHATGQYPTVVLALQSGHHVELTRLRIWSLVIL